MKVLIVTDLEGVNGVLNFDDWCVPEGRRNEAGCRFLTEEVNALLERGEELVTCMFNIFRTQQDMDGIYTLKVFSKDKAGNVDNEEVVFTVNRFGSVYVYDQYLMELIAQKTRFSRAYRTMIQINADFLLAKTRADVQFIFRLRLWDLAVTAVKFLIGFIKEKTKQTQKNTTASTKTPVKEVAK